MDSALMFLGGIESLWVQLFNNLESTEYVGVGRHAMTFERSGAGRAFACAPRSKHKNETHQL